MKTTIYILLICLTVVACSSPKNIPETSFPTQELSVENNDSSEYDLVVFDPRFETFLVTQPYPKEFYSNEFYRNWNQRYCVEWNIRHSNPIRYGDFYETQIPYDSTTDYGLDFNYKLYQYFQFIDKEYGIVLIRRRGR
ncbi:DUF6146 family protein [Carboxylicivirga marina]|uniref:DUF6146 family protein n=1 Tax=Carboxylicivirga marina TaxID=2800988 RepID=UPI0025988E87|nr:DUF6146 family protein [uncultured Carboxylicivirga sp.]